ncbi:MAG: hypothetical protein JXA54_11570 [Candidatus Heimdallarchaeota archaeon]|nr:hypothetical protein [Candidatus Heimdallarchaeota archaeon]
MRIKADGITMILGLVLLLIVIANLISYALIMVVMFGTIILSYKKGFDPDNFLIALFSSFADMVYIAVILFLFVITLGIQ